MDRNKKYFGILEVVIIVIVTGIVCGFSTGLMLINNDSFNKLSYVDLSNDEDLKEFLEVYASIITDYYQDVDKAQLVYYAINGMMSYLGDDYTNYLNKESTEALEQKLSGEYEGIGVRISQGNIIYEVFEGSPAELAGIKKDDVIIKINGVDVRESSTQSVADEIKKSSGGKANIVLLRGGTQIEVNVELRLLNIPSVSYKVLTNKIGLLTIETFSNTTADQVNSALKKLESEGINSLIIDLRDNTGGYLSSAKDIAELFLEKGKVIYSLANKDGQVTVKAQTAEQRKYPIAVLINGSSASAAEILAAALKDSYGAILVGEKTFGKGKVQQTMELDSGGMVKYTSATWLTPNNICIDGLGIEPDYEVKIDYAQAPDSEANEDSWQTFSDYLKSVYEMQLNKALEVLTK